MSHGKERCLPPVPRPLQPPSPRRASRGPGAEVAQSRPHAHGLRFLPRHGPPSGVSAFLGARPEGRLSPLFCGHLLCEKELAVPRAQVLLKKMVPALVLEPEQARPRPVKPALPAPSAGRAEPGLLKKALSSSVPSWPGPRGEGSNQLRSHPPSGLKVCFPAKAWRHCEKQRAVGRRRVRLACF